MRPLRRRHAPALALLAAACTIVVAGCAIGDGGDDGTGATSTAAGSETSMTARTGESTNPPSPSPTRSEGEAVPSSRTHRNPRQSGTLDGAVIHLDPGHAAVVPAGLPQVTDGRGGTKPCQVTGTAAADGWPEHTFNWLMAGAIRERLEARGATVTLGREDDTGPADCIDERARKENASTADVVISLHADGAGEGNRGFHVIAIADPLPGNDADGSLALARAIRDGFVAAGFAPSNYLGTDGIDLRSDLTGLNLSAKPKALVEFGNMRDSADIAVMGSESGRGRMADAVVAGIESALAGRGKG